MYTQSNTAKKGTTMPITEGQKNIIKENLTFLKENLSSTWFNTRMKTVDNMLVQKIVLAITPETGKIHRCGEMLYDWDQSHESCYLTNTMKSMSESGNLSLSFDDKTTIPPATQKLLNYCISKYDSSSD